MDRKCAPGITIYRLVTIADESKADTRFVIPGRMKIRAEMLNRAIFALCLLAPWSLLWLDSSLLFPYETGKAWLFRSIISLAFAVLIVYRFVYTVPQAPMPQFQPKSVALSIRVWQYAMLAFLFWTALTGFVGIDPYRSFWSNYERMSGYLAYIYWAAYFLCLIAVLNLQRAKLLMLNLLGVILLVGLIGLLEAQNRAISTLGNSIYLGNLAVFGIFISGFLYAGSRRSTRWRSGFLGLIFLLVVVILMLVLFKTASRGPMIALIAGALVMLIRLAFAFPAKSRRSILLALTVGAMILVALGAGMNQQLTGLLKNSDSYALQRLSRISLHNQTTIDRFENWKIALDASGEHPLLGWGQDNYAIAYHEYYRAGVMDKAKIWFDRAHNAYLDVLLASGWPGLLLYLLVLFVPIMLVLRFSGWKPLEQAFVLGLFSAFMVKNLVGFDTFSSSLVWLSIAAVLWHAIRKPQPLSDRSVRSYAWVLLILVFIPALWAVVKLSVEPYMENRMYARLINQPRPLQSLSIQRLLRQPASDQTYAPNAKLAVFDQLLRDLNGQALDQQQTAAYEQLYLRAGTLVSRELLRQPRNARISYNGAMLLAYLGQYDLSIRLLESVLLSSPQRTIIWHRLGQVYDAAGQPEAARSAYAKQKSLTANRGKK